MATTKRFVRLSVVTVIAIAVLVLNPVFGLLSEDFHYGAPELRAAVEGTWQLTLTPPDAPAQTLTFTLAQGAEVHQTHATRTLVRPAAACSSRSMVKTAGACLDTTDMPLDVTLIADGQPRPQSDQAMFTVIGTRFERGSLHVTIGEAFVTARVTPRGEAEGVLSVVDGAPGAPSKEVPSTLVRTRP